MAILNGQTPDADEVLAMGNIRQVYTGSGFDSTKSGSGTDTQDHELDAVASAPDSNYAVVKITGRSSIGGDTSSGNTGSISLKAQIKETGGAYADIASFQTIFNSSDYLANRTITTSSTFEVVATLTAGQKTNGFQIKVFSQSTGGATDGTGSFVNFQTIQEVRT